MARPVTSKLRTGRRLSRRAVVLLVCAVLVSTPFLTVAAVGMSAWYYVYVDRDKLPDLGAFARFEFPTIGHVYDVNGEPLISLAREYRDITRY